MRHSLLFVGGAAAAIVALAQIGCETQSADEPITISPSSITISKGQSIPFTASGGYEYTWALSTDGEDASYGSLNRRTGDSVLYTAHTAPSDADKTVVLTASSWIPGSDPGGTSNDVSTVLATTEAYIRHPANTSTN